MAEPRSHLGLVPRNSTGEIAGHSQPTAQQPPLGRDNLTLPIAGIPLVLSVGFLLASAFEPDAMIFLALMTFTSLLLLAWRAVSTHQRASDVGLVVFLGANIYWFGAPALPTALSDQQWDKRAAHLVIHNDDALLTFVAVNLFICTALVGYEWGKAQSTVRLRHVLGADFWPPGTTLALLLIVSTLLALAFYVAAAGGISGAVSNIVGSRTAATPWASEGNEGTSLTPFHIISSAMLVFSSGFAFYALQTGRIRGVHRVALLGIAILSALTVILESGTRSTTLQIILPPTVLFYRSTMAGDASRRATRLVLIAGAGIIALAISNFQLEYRKTAEVTEVPSLRIEHNDFFSMASFAMASQEACDCYTHDSSLYLIATGPIPRVLWSGKPESEAIAAFSLRYWGRDIEKKGGNTLPSVVGQYYMAWGWFGILEVGLTLGFLIGWGDRLIQTLRSQSPLIYPYAVFLSYMFVGFRFLGFNFFPPVIMAWFMIRWITRRAYFASGLSQAPTS